MKERAARFGGRLRVKMPGAGTMIHADSPFQAGSAMKETIRILLVEDQYFAGLRCIR